MNSSFSPSQQVAPPLQPFSWLDHDAVLSIVKALDDDDVFACSLVCRMLRLCIRMDPRFANGVRTCITSMVTSLPRLQWARANAYDCKKWTWHLDVLQWARANGCDWDSQTCASAAEGGHLEVLQWARANGCDWNKWTCASAARGGHLHVLKWARAKGCDWDRWTCTGAAQGGHLDVLKWANTNGCDWYKWTCAYAAGYIDLLQWARANGCDPL